MTTTNSPLRWGILGLGKIAHHFVHDLQLLNAEITAAASRSQEKATKFAQTYHIANAHGNYKSLFLDSKVDIIYIATPHHAHADLAIAAMEAGKHVLCEKPMGVNQSEVKRMVETAQKNQVFLMEALWTRFNPSYQAIREQLRNGAIGTVNYLQADFGFVNTTTPEGRLLNMNLAGGALLDIGIYPVFLAYSLFGKPEKIMATARFHENGADVQNALIFHYKEAIAVLGASLISEVKMEAKICGTGGQIIMKSRWHEADGYTLKTPKNELSVDLKKYGKGYTHEIVECEKCIQNGQLESPLWTHQNSLDLIELLDVIRGQIGLKYPFE